MKETRTFNYWCSNRQKCDSCKYCKRSGDLQIETSVEVKNGPENPTEVFSCPNNEGVQLKLLGLSLPKRSFQPMKPSEVRKERLQRSREHFKKEVFHTLDADGQRHHVNKNPDLKPSVDISLPKVSEGAKKEISKKLK